MQPRNATVIIVGAGPAGLVLGCLLQSAGIDAMILEHRSHEHCVTRARAGYLAPNTARVLHESALAAGMFKHGQQHGTCEFRAEGLQFELAYDTLGRCEPHFVYPQQDLVRDLIEDFRGRGGEIRFDTAALAIHEVTTDRPWVECRGVDGEPQSWRGQYVAGCDGQHGISREALPAGSFRSDNRDHGVSWLAILAQAPQSMGSVVYAVHADGFAGHMARSPSVTRYYIQCPHGEDPDEWSDDRIWEVLSRRMRADDYGPLIEGPIIERGLVDLTSTVINPIQYGSLLLVGDAASLISPCAAKGANLAVMEAEVLASAIVTALKDGDDRALTRYSAECLPRIWRAQEFSHWMINLLHSPPGDGEDSRFLRALQHARLCSLQSSRAFQDYFAENYVGI
jgi:p-hydroxybenzoate 3-monooxygenase